MKVLKTILFILLALVVLYLVLCFVGLKRLDTTRSTEIDAPAAVINNQVNNLKNWENWYPWSKADTTMKITYGNKTVGVGGNYSWTSKQGNGTLEIIESSIGSIKTKMTFENWDGNSFGHWVFSQAEGGSTNVSWGMANDTDIPLLMRGMVMISGMKKSIEKSFEDGLTGIKTIAENSNSLIKNINVIAIDIPEKYYVMNRNKISVDAMPKYFADNFPVMSQVVSEAGGDINGMPSAVFYDWSFSQGVTDVGASIPVTRPIIIKGYDNITIPEGKVLIADHFGPYFTSIRSHIAIESYMKANKLEYLGPAVEEYVNDPTTVEEDKIHTKITYYIK